MDKSGFEKKFLCISYVLAHRSNFDHLEMLKETGGYKGSAVFLPEVVWGFLFYAPDVHNDQEDINILGFSSHRSFN